MRSDRSPQVAFLLCLFLGGLGAHRFYLGKTGTAAIQLATLCYGVIIHLWITAD